MSLLYQILNTIRENCETTHSGSNKHTCFDFVNLIQLLTTKIGILERLLSGDKAITKAIVQSAVVLPIDVTLGAEIPDLPGESGGKLGSIEAVYETNATLAGEKLVVIGVYIVAEDGHQAHSGNHDPFIGVRLALRSRYVLVQGGGGGDVGDLLGF